MLFCFIVVTVFVIITLCGFFKDRQLNILNIRKEDGKTVSKISKEEKTESSRGASKSGDWRANVDLSETNVTRNGKWDNYNYDGTKKTGSNGSKKKN